MIVGYVSVFECRLACAEYINMLMFDERYPTVMPDFGCLLLMARIYSRKLADNNNGSHEFHLRTRTASMVIV